MQTNVATAQKSTRHNSLDSVCLKPAKASIEINSDGRELIDVLFAVIDESGMQRKEAASLMGYDPAQFSRGHISLGRVPRLPLEIQQAFIGRFAISVGLVVQAASPEEQLKTAIRNAIVHLLTLMEKL